MKNMSKENYIDFEIEKALINESSRMLLFNLEEVFIQLVEKIKG